MLLLLKKVIVLELYLISLKMSFWFLLAYKAQVFLLLILCWISLHFLAH